MKKLSSHCRNLQEFAAHMEKESGKLSPKQEALIAELVAGKTIKDASQSVEISERTAYIWLKQPLFDKEYKTAKQTAYDERMETLRSGVSIALRTLLRHMTSNDTKPYVQVQAASIWLQQSIDLNKMQELEERIKELEKDVKEKLNGRH